MGTLPSSLNLGVPSCVCVYLVAVVFDQLEDKASVHEREQVIQEESQADVDLLCLFQLLQTTTTITDQ